MNKRLIGIVIGVISLVALIAIILITSPRIKFNNIIISSETYENIKSTRELIKDDVLTSISFNNYNLFKSSNGEDLYYSLLKNSMNRYNPSIKYHTSLTKSKIAVVENQITDEIIENNQEIIILLYNDQFYKEYHLVSTTLPIMNINYSSHFDESTDMKVNMDMYLFDNQDEIHNRDIVSHGEISVRGNLASTYPKKAYNIALKQESLGYNKRNNDISLLNMRKDNNYILYPAYNDQEKVRNVLASRIWYESSATNNEFDVINGMYYKYIELFINNEYHGLYALGFPINEAALQLKSNIDGVYTEYTFKKNEREGMANDYVLKTNGKTDHNEYNVLNNHRKELKDARTVKELKEVIDYNNAIDSYLFIQLILGVDNLDKNMYMTLKENNGKYKALYTPWDLDITFGNASDKMVNNNTIPYRYNYNYALDEYDNPIMKLNSSVIKEDIKNRYKELRNNAWSNDTLNSYIDEYEKDIYSSGAFLRDKDRWTEGNYNSSTEKLSKIKEFMKNRLTYSDEYINK